MWTGENEMVMECRDCGYSNNWREFDFHFGDACPECGSRAVGKKDTTPEEPKSLEASQAGDS
mgnify:CR=1